MKTKTILFLILGAGLAVILLQNTETVNFKVYFWEFGISRIILIPLLLIIGFLSGYAVNSIRKKQKPDSGNPEEK